MGRAVMANRHHVARAAQRRPLGVCFSLAARCAGTAFGHGSKPFRIEHLLRREADPVMEGNPAANGDRPDDTQGSRTPTSNARARFAQCLLPLALGTTATAIR